MERCQSHPGQVTIYPFVFFLLFLINSTQYNAIHRYPTSVCIIYTGDVETEAEKILANANERLNIQLCPERTKFVYLRLRFLTLDKYYPMFTLLGQSIGSVLLAIEAFTKMIPDIYFETTGYAFTYPIFYYVAGIPVACYTHYPTIR